MISRNATIASKVGLHARPAAIFANAAGESDFEITISFGGEDADAASILDVMSLGAMNGDEVTLSCDDDAAEQTIDELVTLLETDLEE